MSVRCGNTGGRCVCPESNNGTGNVANSNRINTTVLIRHVHTAPPSETRLLNRGWSHFIVRLEKDRRQIVGGPARYNALNTAAVFLLGPLDHRTMASKRT